MFDEIYSMLFTTQFEEVLEMCKNWRPNNKVPKFKDLGNTRWIDHEENRLKINCNGEYIPSVRWNTYNLQYAQAHDLCNVIVSLRVLIDTMHLDDMANIQNLLLLNTDFTSYPGYSQEYTIRFNQLKRDCFMVLAPILTKLLQYFHESFGLPMNLMNYLDRTMKTINALHRSFRLENRAVMVLFREQTISRLCRRYAIVGNAPTHKPSPIKEAMVLSSNVARRALEFII